MSASPTPRRRIVPLLAAALVLSAAAGGPVAAGAPATLAIAELDAVRVNVDVGVPGPSAGDRAVFRAPVTIGEGNGDGGTVYGVTTTVRMPSDAAPDGLAVTMVAYDLGAGSTIVLAGVDPRPAGVEPPAGTELRRTILGGTGRFSGARGVLATTVGADGTWSNAMTLLGVGDAVTRTFTVRAPVAPAARATGPAEPLAAGALITDWFPIVAGATRGRGAATLTGVSDAVVDGDPFRLALCLVALDLGGGDRLHLAGLTPIAAGAPGPRRPTMPLAVIGGTGRFAGARGEDVVTFTPTGSIHAIRLVGRGAPEGSLGAGSAVALATVDNDPTEIELGGGSGTSLGDLWTWTSRTEEDGMVDGSSVGLLTNVAVERSGTTRLGLAFYLRPEGDLVVASLDAYPAPGAPITVGSRRVRAIVGGTGETLGAAGTVAMERAGDDRFDYVFALVTPATAGE